MNSKLENQLRSLFKIDENGKIGLNVEILPVEDVTTLENAVKSKSSRKLEDLLANSLVKQENGIAINAFLPASSLSSNGWSLCPFLNLDDLKVEGVYILDSNMTAMDYTLGGLSLNLFNEEANVGFVRVEIKKSGTSDSGLTNIEQRIIIGIDDDNKIIQLVRMYIEDMEEWTLPIITNSKYSEDESIVGFWVTGAPIYEKVITHSFNDVGNQILDTDINIKAVLSISGYIEEGDNARSLSGFVKIYLDNGNTPQQVVYIKQNLYSGGETGYVVMRYLKR